MNIFKQNNYREILEMVISERKRLDSSINFQQMASFVRVPKSYLSRVVHGKADLSTDQLYLVCQYLDFNEQESAYMQLILEYARTGVKSRKDKLSREIRKIQAQYLETKEHLKAETVNATSDEITTYYLDPLIQLTHICLSIPRYQKDQNLLAVDLKVQPGRLLAAINKLEQMRLITRCKDGIKLLVENVHLPRQSPVYRSWRNQLKLLAINKIDTITDEQAYSFSVVFSANDEIRRQIQSSFLSYLKGIEELVRKGPQEHAYQMSFELFPWTQS